MMPQNLGVKRPLKMEDIDTNTDQTKIPSQGPESQHVNMAHFVFKQYTKLKKLRTQIRCPNFFTDDHRRFAGRPCRIILLMYLNAKTCY